MSYGLRFDISKNTRIYTVRFVFFLSLFEKVFSFFDMLLVLILWMFL